MALLDDLSFLSQNDPELTFLQLLRPEADTSDSAVQHLMDVLEKNSHIKGVRMLAPADLPLVVAANDAISSKKLKLFQAVGRLPKLKQLKIESFSGLVSFPVMALSSTLQSARNLVELELWDLNFATNHNYIKDLYILQASLQDHPSLQKFTLYNCHLENTTAGSSSQRALLNENDDTDDICGDLPPRNLDPLLHALATITTLKKVYMTDSAAASASTQSLVKFTCAALKRLCQSKSLKELGLWKFNFTQESHNNLTSETRGDSSYASEPLSSMAPAIAETNTLKVFELGECQLTKASDMALGRMLETNTSLEELDLHLGCNKNKKQGAIARNLTSNGGSTEFLAKALKKNKTLRRLMLWGLLSRQDQQNLLDMIRHNCYLETLRLLDADGDITVKIDFYIRLNRKGRRHLIGMKEDHKAVVAGHHEWLKMLASSGNNLSDIFYYLLLNPGLCQVGTWNW